MAVNPFAPGPARRYAPEIREQGRTGAAYRAFAAHYNECATCARDDWFDPVEGEPHFCDEGRRLWRAWLNTIKQAFASVGRTAEWERG